MTNAIYHIAGETYHKRRGATQNAFRYSIDYILLDAEANFSAPYLFARNAKSLMSLYDTDHGGAPTTGQGAKWARDVLAAHALGINGRIDLLAQPRMLGHVFNPVSFWLCYDQQDVLRVVIAEVSNTFGDRHSYLCHHQDLSEITKSETMTSTKVLHVSPFQSVAGGYVFRFDIQPDRIAIWIDYRSGDDGVIATLSGVRKPLTNLSIIRAALRRPFGSRRVLALIHWQAIKLWWKGAPFQSRPKPPEHEVSK